MMCYDEDDDDNDLDGDPCSILTLLCYEKASSCLAIQTFKNLPFSY